MTGSETWPRRARNTQSSSTVPGHSRGPATEGPEASRHLVEEKTVLWGQ